MDSTYPPEAWKRLGIALEKRRGELGYGFRRREDFNNDRGRPVSGKMLARLERGERSFYPDSTIAVLERLYGLPAGSFEAILKGEDLPEAGSGPKAGPRDGEGLAAYLAQLIAMAPDPDIAQGILRIPDHDGQRMPVEKQVKLLEVWLQSEGLLETRSGNLA